MASGSNNTGVGQDESYRQGAFKRARISAIRWGELIPLRVQLIDPDTASVLFPPLGTAGNPQQFSWEFARLAEDGVCRRAVLPLPPSGDNEDIWELFERDIVEPARLMLPAAILKGRKVREVRGVLEECDPKVLDNVAATTSVYNSRTLMTWLCHSFVVQKRGESLKP